jgi:hypothetical protein
MRRAPKVAAIAATFMVMTAGCGGGKPNVAPFCNAVRGHADELRTQSGRPAASGAAAGLASTVREAQAKVPSQAPGEFKDDLNVLIADLDKLAAGAALTDADAARYANAWADLVRYLQLKCSIDVGSSSGQPSSATGSSSSG